MKSFWQARNSAIALGGILSLVATGLVLFVTPANAAQVLCTENAFNTTNGCGGYLVVDPVAGPEILVVSDGETPFDPFNAGYDTSDGVQLPAGWVPDPAAAAAFGPGFWTQTAPGTWVLPAALGPCGSENEPVCEPVARWFLPNATWSVDQIQTFYLLELNGNISDIATLDNSGPGGTAALTFASDPLGVPEPAIWTTMLLGFFGVGFMMRRSRNASPLATA